MLNRRGLTLLESTIALIILGMIVAGVWIAFARTNFNHNLIRTERGILVTLAKVRNFYGDRVPASGEINNARAVELGLIAPELLIGGTPMHYLGQDGTGTLEIGNDPAICENTANLFFLRLNDMSSEGCHQLAARLLGNARRLNEYGISYGGVDGVSFIEADGSFNVNQAMSECGDIGDFVVCFR